MCYSVGILLFYCISIILINRGFIQFSESLRRVDWMENFHMSNSFGLCLIATLLGFALTSTACADESLKAFKAIGWRYIGR